MIKYNKTILLFLSILFYYHSFSQPLIAENYEYRHIQKTKENDVEKKGFIISPSLSFAKSSSFGLDLGFGKNEEIGSGGGGFFNSMQAGIGYFQPFNNEQHYMRLFAEFDIMYIVCLPPPSLSLRVSYVNGSMLGTNEQYIIPEIGYNLVYVDLTASFPIALQKTNNLFISFNIRGHILLSPKKWQKSK